MTKSLKYFILFIIVLTISGCGGSQSSTAPAPQMRNLAPKVNNVSLEVVDGSSLSITLTGTDSDGVVAVCRAETLPAIGTLSGTNPNLVFTNNNSIGETSFSYSCTDNDGAKSNYGIVNITIIHKPANTSHVFIEGDSFSVAFGSWADKLTPEYSNNKFAFGGRKLSAMVEDFGADYNLRTDAPFVVLWAGGINDIYGNATAEDLKQIYTNAIAATPSNASAILFNLPPFLGNPGGDQTKLDHAKSVNEWLETQTSDNVYLFDMYDILVERNHQTIPSRNGRIKVKYKGGDWLHPNEAGHDAISIALKSFLKDNFEE